MDMKLELVEVPVTNVERTKAFYVEQAGFNADHDHQVSDLPALRAADAVGLGMLDRHRYRHHRHDARLAEGPAARRGRHRGHP
jgi:catechol 2,3-dioxygenase-like lactoylglutathione lyase family enzyme